MLFALFHFSSYSYVLVYLDRIIQFDEVLTADIKST